MSDEIVTIQQNAHANLDSFPFRYGFSQTKDFQLFLKFDSGINTTFDGRKIIENAKFTNPKTGQDDYGNFVISKDNHVVTVIREDEGVDETLSKALKLFRKYEYVTVKELIEYFHPLYIEGKIKTHSDLKKYWIRMYDTDPDKIKKMEASISQSLSELDKEKERHDETRVKLNKVAEQIIIKDSEIEEIQQSVKSKDELISNQSAQIEIQNKEKEELKIQVAKLEEQKIASEQRNSDSNQRKKDYPDINWNERKVTSAVFNFWEIQGDFLCIYLVGNNKPIKLKNTFKYDYPKALETVKQLSKGDLIDYVTKASSLFSADYWFSEIIAVQNIQYEQVKYQDPIEQNAAYGRYFEDTVVTELPESVKQNIHKEALHCPIVTPGEEMKLSGKVTRLSKFTIAEGIALLKKQKFTSETTFKIEFCTYIPGHFFLEFFGHNWIKDMIYLETDKGCFVDTTIWTHGGTEWLQGETYDCCRVTPTKGNTMPYWLQKDNLQIPF